MAKLKAYWKIPVLVSILLGAIAWGLYNKNKTI